MTEQQQPKSFAVCCWAPSNIAFLKYWGKASVALQWPSGPSLSMTLRHAQTRTQISTLSSQENQQQGDHQELNEKHPLSTPHAGAPTHTLSAPKPSRPGLVDVIVYHGKQLDPTDHRYQRIVAHLDFLRSLSGKQEFMRVDTDNTFPEACGIASSASGFAALTVAGLAFLHRVTDFAGLKAHGYDLTRLAQAARMGSGSAGRSLFGGFALWHPRHSAELQTIEPLKLEPEWLLADTILVTSSVQKKVSSSKAHTAAESSPLYQTRLAGLEEKLHAFKAAIEARDMTKLGPLLEAEALEMHAVALSSEPSICYLNASTQKLLAWIRERRRTEHFPAYFTLDAGSTVHLIYEQKERHVIENGLKAFPGSVHMLHDELGSGPKLEAVKMNRQGEAASTARTGRLWDQSTLIQPPMSQAEASQENARTRGLE